MPEPRPKTNLSHDDYCRLFGRVILDTFLRIDSLEKQFTSMYESFQAQTEDLRSQLREERATNGTMGKRGADAPNFVPSAPDPDISTIER
jgi:hypothetical protein